LIYKEPGVTKTPTLQAQPDSGDESTQHHSAATNLKFENVPMAPPEGSEGKTKSIPVKTDSHALQETLDSLPVLEAFQEFLEVERAKTRRRLLVLSLSYLFLLAVIISGGLFGGMIVIRRFNANIQKVQDNFQLVQNDVSNLKAQALKSRADTDTLSARLSEEAIKIRTDLGSSSDETKNKILSQVNTHDDRISKMDDKLLSLQKENATLRNSLISMQKQWMSLTNELVTSLVQVRNLKAQAVKEPAAAQQMASILRTISIPITPRGQKHPVEWRIPIPE